MRRDGTGREAVVPPPGAGGAERSPADWVAGLAVDWVGHNVFWGEPRRRVVHAATPTGEHR